MQPTRLGLVKDCRKVEVFIYRNHLVKETRTTNHRTLIPLTIESRVRFTLRTNLRRRLFNSEGSQYGKELKPNTSRTEILEGPVYVPVPRVLYKKGVGSE